MTDEKHLRHREKVDRFELGEIHSASEWDDFFKDAVALLSAPDRETQDYATDRLQKGVWAESMQRHRQPGFLPATTASRLGPILETIAGQGEERDMLLLRFTKWLSGSPEINAFVVDWLTAREGILAFDEDTIILTKIFFEMYPQNDWLAAKPFLEPYFDHTNVLLRAAAASALGSLYCAECPSLPPIVDMMHRVKEWEIERPGFAGPFVGEFLTFAEDDGPLAGTGINLTDWMLEIVARRKAEEPHIPFYVGIDFHAHELMSMNPDAVRKLIEFGAEELAAMTATEENHVVPGMQPLLEQLARSDDDFICRICSWQLASCYRFLHSEGERRGYVRQIARDGIVAFFAFLPEEFKERPCAVTIYPEKGRMDETTAWMWIDRLIPPEIRPADDDGPLSRSRFPEKAWYRFGSYIVQTYGDTEKKEWDRVWVKWPHRLL